jgi:uncharacterized protein (DUF1778 family)
MPRTIRSAGGGKRYPLSLRTTQELRQRLEAAAGASGRSLAQEVEFLLDRALAPRRRDADDVIQTVDRLMGSLTTAEDQIQTRLGAGTLSGPDRDMATNCLLLLSALRALAVALRPQGAQFGATFEATVGRPTREEDR